MRESSKEIKELVTALSEFAIQSKTQIKESREQNKELSGEIKKVANNQEKLAEQMAELVKINVKAQAWNEKHNEDKERLEQNQRAQGKKLDSYIQSNDDRVVTIEKQIILLDADSSSNKKKNDNSEKRKETIKDRVIGAILTAAALGGLTIIWKVVIA